MFITERLLALADIPYRDFTAKLIPTIDKERIIGVRTPAMRSLAKELLKQQPKEAMAFLEKLPHYYYEENNLHAFIIAQLNDFEKKSMSWTIYRAIPILLKIPSLQILLKFFILDLNRLKFGHILNFHQNSNLRVLSPNGMKLNSV